MKRFLKILALLTLILGIGSIITAFNYEEDHPEDLIIEGNVPTEFTVMQNDNITWLDISNQNCYLKNRKTGKSEKIFTISIPSQSEIGTYQIEVSAWLQNNQYFSKKYEASVTVIPFNSKLTITVPKVIKPHKWWSSNYLSSDRLKDYKIYAFNNAGNSVDGYYEISSQTKLYWGYNKYEGFFIPSDSKYEKTQCSIIVFDNFTTKISTTADSIYISLTNNLNNTHQTRINGGKWRSIKETNKLKLKPNTKYKVEIRQKAESFHKAIILQTSYVKTKKNK